MFHSYVKQPEGMCQVSWGAFVYPPNYLVSSIKSRHPTYPCTNVADAITNPNISYIYRLYIHISRYPPAGMATDINGRQWNITTESADGVFPDRGFLNWWIRLLILKWSKIRRMTWMISGTQ